ncbi:cAMP-dependent protein kinase catalytic subunit 1-like [Schistocerca cancellata]|uniref:cAMP-dependent protein kinase catalytic subunit 1-like n=1 Tax=Schistocerca cancellata TaxID=274614 RepID=UPI0021196BBD|nr:cAMP-dependent protein kinase catalytic subunit 1-like [Schistocerca cancellata]
MSLNTERDDSFPIINDYEEFLKKSKNHFENTFNKKVSTTMSIEEFSCIRTLGTGSFGRVMLVRHKGSGNYYAIKILDKSRIVKLRQIEHTLNEKKILQALRFPFIVYLEYSFMDSNYIYFAMPFVSGGEMFSLLRKSGKFEETQSKFYAAQVVLALEYMHYLDIIYRDLKPENILIDRFGYLKVTDLGFCKVISSRTWTLCGTPEYIAPEIILSKGYGMAVDWWSFGVLVYEMSAGFPPFYAKEPMKIYEKILSGKYRNAPSFGSDVKDLIKNLLQVDVTRRFGNLKNGVDDIKNHRWFNSINWLEILNREIKPPYVPSLKSSGDSSNFDQYREEPLKQSGTDRYAREFRDF